MQQCNECKLHHESVFTMHEQNKLCFKWSQVTPYRMSEITVS